MDVKVFGASSYSSSDHWGGNDTQGGQISRARIPHLPSCPAPWAPSSPDNPPTVGAPPATEGASVKEPGAPVETETQGKKEPPGGTTHVKEEYGYIVTNQRSSNPNVHKHWNVGVGAYICLSVYVSVSESLTVHGVCM